MQTQVGSSRWGPGRRGRFLPRALSAAVLVAVPCLALLGFGPGLAQVLTADAWAGETVMLDRPVAPADLSPRPENVSGTAAEVVVLANWEATDCHDRDDHRHHGGGGGGGGGSIAVAVADIADAQVQTQTALGLVNAAITLLGSTNHKNVALAFADLRQAGVDETRAATDLIDASSQAIKANQLGLASSLIPLAGQMSSIATQMVLGAQYAQKLDPPAPSQSYVLSTLLPLGNQGVSVANQAAIDISPFQ